MPAQGTPIGLPAYDRRFEFDFDMPPEELVEHVATLMATGLYRAKLPWLPGEKIKKDDLKGTATFVIGGLLALQKAGQNGSQN